MADSVAVLNQTQRRLLADITASGLFADQSAILTTAFLLAKRHSDKAQEFKKLAEQGLDDVKQDHVGLAFSPPPGSQLQEWVVTRTAFADMDEIGRDDPQGEEDNPYTYFIDGLVDRGKRPANLFRRTYLPPATRLLFIWPYVGVVRFGAERNELLRVLHSSVDVKDVYEAEWLD
jgi:hypothetical protein